MRWIIVSILWEFFMSHPAKNRFPISSFPYLNTIWRTNSCDRDFKSRASCFETGLPFFRMDFWSQKLVMEQIPKSRIRISANSRGPKWEHKLKRLHISRILWIEMCGFWAVFVFTQTVNIKTSFKVNFLNIHSFNLTFELV